MATPLRLKSLSPERIAAALAADPRLIVPIGTNDPFGPHLPIGCDTVVIERLADDLSAEFGVLRAATIEYGASDEAAAGPPRAGSVRKKTLHLLLNDLLLSWERAGVREFILLTFGGDEAHREALATAMTLQARVRLVDAHGGLQQAPSAKSGCRGGEADTSLMLFLAPQLVDMRSAQDYTPESPLRRRTLRRPPAPAPADDPDDPTRGSAGRGEALYRQIRAQIVERVFGEGPRSRKGAP